MIKSISEIDFWTWVSIIALIIVLIIKFTPTRKMAKCSNCNRTIWFFQTSCACNKCDYVECENCYNSHLSLKECEKCNGLFCKQHIDKHSCNQNPNEEKMSEKIECTNCGNEVDESKVIECSNCSNQFCKDCIQLIIGFKNSTTKFTYNFTNKQKAKDVYADLTNKWKSATQFFEYNETTILMSEISYIDLRL